MSHGIAIAFLVVALVLIAFGRLRRITPVAIAGYLVLVAAAAIEFYVRRQ